MTAVHPLLVQIRRVPLVAILRGLDPAHAEQIGATLVDAGFCALEVPLNRPGALLCIEILTKSLPPDILVGGGTMLTLDDVENVYSAGGRLMVAPNYDVRVIERAASLGMLVAPGVATPTEAFGALHAGAHALKIFPADMVGAGGLKALKSVLPPDTDLWPVGGITPQSMVAWRAAGATGFGIGSHLYTPGKSAAEVADMANKYIQSWTIG
jgi:2-dehydro-3-deoxyphosphogalactonate aldolase